MSDPERTAKMRPDALAHSESNLIPCAGCEERFTPVRPWQRFHSTDCRRDFHRRKGVEPLRAKVSKVSILKGGIVSAVVRFDAADASRACRLEPGTELELL